MRGARFHGRFEDSKRGCEAPGCEEAGEFRAPGSRSPGFDGPGDWRWFCLDHVREFNAGYDWFEGMSADEIYAAQSPLGGWARETRAFRPGAHGMPRWSDFDDPLDAIHARSDDIRARATGEAQRRAAYAAAHPRFTVREHEALSLMGLTTQSDRPALRRRYAELVRRYHPDRNGGDRSHEARLRQVVEAYQLLRKAAAFA